MCCWRAGLRELGHEAECELMAKRHASHDPGKFIYSEPVVIHAAADLPEGAYTLHFENISTPVQHKGVLWLVAGPPPAAAEAGKADAGAPTRPGKGAVNLARRLIRDRRKH